MFNKQTVLIIGAGASAEFKMPTGPELQTKIAALLDLGSSQSADFWRNVGGQHGQDRMRQLMEAAPILQRTVRDRFKSIDEVLHFERGNTSVVELGKLCIAHQILRAERDSILSHAMAEDAKAVALCNATWASKFISLALSESTRDQIDGLFRNLTIVNFNYDRVIEQYLFWALQRNYGFPQDMAAHALSADKLKVLRPYGSIGELSWQDVPQIEYGGEPTQIEQIANRLRTYTEEMPSKNAQDIKAAINDGRVFVVIGFGYHGQNIDILRPVGGALKRQCFMTVYGVPPENNDAIKLSMQYALLSEIEPMLYDMRGSILLEKVGLAISLATR